MYFIIVIIGLASSWLVVDIAVVGFGVVVVIVARSAFIVVAVLRRRRCWRFSLARLLFAFL